MVPAHLDSVRLAEKVLVDIKGKAMLLRVLEQCKQAVGRGNVCVVTPDQKIEDAVNGWGFDVYQSSPDLPDGSSAIASAAPRLEVDYIVNVQGDQPLVPPELIQSLIKNLAETGADMVTPVFRITELEDLGEKGVAKVIRDLDGWALYFSRSPIPYVRDIWSPVKNWNNYGFCKTV
jgi:3-deoxy-manno-octulosonate cytidylyltransferase (CMP-KDO synthetase)